MKLVSKSYEGMKKLGFLLKVASFSRQNGSQERKLKTKSVADRKVIEKKVPSLYASLHVFFFVFFFVSFFVIFFVFFFVFFFIFFISSFVWLS